VLQPEIDVDLVEINLIWQYQQKLFAIADNHVNFHWVSPFNLSNPFSISGLITLHSRVPSPFIG
jgi:hypothetical protein